MELRFIAVFLATFLSAISAAGQSYGDVAKGLEKELKGHVFYLRGFPQGVFVRYEPDGTNPSGRPGIWSLHGVVMLDNVRATENGLDVRARRLVAIFHPKKKDFEFAKTPDYLQIRLPLTDPSLEAARKSLNRITLSRIEMPAAMPPYWQEYWKDPDAAVEQAEGKRKFAAPAGIEKVGKDVKAPKAKHTPDPTYNEEARRYGLMGTPVFRMVIDEIGNPAEIYLLRPAGAGFDEQSYEALRTWKFDPATRNGVPVKVAVNVEVSFELY